MVSGADADLDDETRVAKILADRWVHYPQGEAALTRMAELLRGARRTRMPSLLVVGEPDVGKTTILKKFMRAHAPIFDPETGRTSSEVVAMEAPPEADEARLYSAILQAIGAPEGGRLIDMERIVHLQLRRLGARLLVIDETNNLMIGTGSAQRKTLAALRRLSNRLELSLACFGTMEALHALTSDPQVEGRVQPFQLTRLRNDADYATIVRSVIAFFPLRQTSEVDHLGTIKTGGVYVIPPTERARITALTARFGVHTAAKNDIHSSLQKTQEMEPILDSNYNPI